MTQFLQVIFTWTTTAAVVGICALLLAQILRRFASARSEYMAWVAVLLLVLLLPAKPSIKPVVMLHAFAPASQSVTVVPDPVQFVPVQTEAPAVRTAAFADDYVMPSSETAQYAALQAEHRFAFRLTLPLACMAVYVLGVFALFTYHLVRHLRFMRHIRRWQKPVEDTRILAVYERVRDEMHIRRDIPVYICPAADSPMAAGIFRPRLLLPDERLNLTELNLVLRHELTHIKRCDLYFKALQTAAVCLHWFNPLVHVMNRAMNYACEASCDESVVRGADMDQRQYYSETIIAVIRRQSRLRTALSTSFYGGKKGMKNRISTIMDPRVRRMGALLLIPVLLLSLFFTVAVATEPAKSTNPPDAVMGSNLEKETGELVAQDKAFEIALQMLKDYDDQRAFEPVSFEIRNIAWMDVPVETAVVRMQLKENPEIVKIAYFTARACVPLEIRQIASYDRNVENSRWLDVEYVMGLRRTDYRYNTLPQTAYITAPGAHSANMCEGTTSYTYPQGTYYNGVKVTVLELHTMLNNAHLTNDNTVTWARVQIGETLTSDGNIGWMPLPALTHEKDMLGEMPALPTAQLKTDSYTGFITVYKQNDLKSTVLTTLQQGTAVKLLGRLRDFYHVELMNGQQGFVEVAYVQVDEVWRDIVTACEPENYDQIQPGFSDLYDEYMAKQDELWEKYGDSNDWPLEVRAARTQLQLAYGFDCEEGRQMHILPGEKDLTEEEARVIANAQIMEQYGMGPENYYKRNVYFFYYAGEESTRYWQFRYSATAGYHDSWVRMNAQTGEIVEVGQVEWVSDVGLPPEESSYAQDELGYYLQMGIYIVDPAEEDKAKEEACVKLAEETFMTVYPEYAGLESYETEASVFHDGKGLKWYLVDVVVAEGDCKTAFSIVVTLEDEPRIFHTNVDDFRQNIADIRQEQIVWDLEKIKGPFYTWTLEEQAQYRPDSHLLPTEDMITKEEAIARAKEHLLLEIMTEEELAEYEAYPQLINYGYDEWRIHFYKPEDMYSEYLDGYQVGVDPVTGKINIVFTPGGNG